MEYWEFLIQKEGDRSWLPLESTNVEILEGRYRIVARSSRVNTRVETRITHQAIDETPPKRRVQNRSNRTNAEGLMVVIPFTRLKPGIWEFRCSGDVMADFMGQPWRYEIRLQVLAQDTEGETEWEPIWQTPSEVSQSEPAVSSRITATDRTGSAIAASSTSAPEAAPVVPAPAASVPAKPAPTKPAPAEPTPVAATTLPTETKPQVQNPPELSTLAPNMAEEMGTAIEQLIQIAEQVSQQLVEETLQEMEDISPPMTTEASPRSTSAASSTSINLVSDEDFSISLAETGYVAHRGQSVDVVGTLESHMDDPAVWAALSRKELQYCLRDPQTAHVLIDQRLALSDDALPQPFSCHLSIPDTYKTRLLLGEIILHAAIAPDSPLQVLATQSFTVTADLDELFGRLDQLSEAIADDFEEQAFLELPLETEPRSGADKPPAVPKALDLSFLALTDTAKQSKQPFRFHPSAGTPLPPQIYQPDSVEATTKSLQLPAFPTPSKTLDAITADGLVTPEKDLDTLDPSSQSKSMDESVAEASLNPLSGETLVEADGTTAQVDVEEDDSSRLNQDDFKALKLQDRFFNRLNALAADTSPEWSEDGEEPLETAALEEEIQAVERAAQAEFDAAAIATSTPGGSELMLASSLLEPDADLAAQEFVVEDDVPAPSRSSVTHSTRSPAQSVNLPDASSPLLLPEDQSVPTPTLDISSGELIAGKTVTIWVKLPDLLPRIYVKLWITDLQTRSLLEGPRWLVDFSPNGLGHLEAMTQITIPLGSLDIQFEAIAVEMHTQRESHKATVERAVVPPDLPTLQLEDFDT